MLSFTSDGVMDMKEKQRLERGTSKPTLGIRKGRTERHQGWGARIAFAHMKVAQQADEGQLQPCAKVSTTIYKHAFSQDLAD